MSSLRGGSWRGWRPRGAGGVGRPAAAHVLPWVLSIALLAVVYLSPRHIVSATTLLTGLLGLCVVLLATRRPDRSLLILIVLLPFQGLILARLWAWGLPASVAGHLGAWKEALALGVVLAGARNLMAGRSRLDALDRVALGFVALCALYALVQPHLLPGSPAASNVRLLGFRETSGFVLLLVGARHASFPGGFAARAARAILFTGTAVAAIGLYEWADSAGWNDFVVHTMKYTQYQIAVLHTHPANPADIRIYGVVGGSRSFRIGSVFLDSLTLGWYLILPLAVGVERLIRRAASPLVLAATVLVGIALLRTETRSAILGGIIVVALTIAPAAGRGSHWRTRGAVLVLGLLVLMIPLAFSTGLTRRLAAANNRTDTSTAGHISGFWSGIDTLGHHPLGLGLGTGAGTGQRFAVKGDVIPENNYLEVGDELGVAGLVLFLALAVALIAVLRRAAARDPEPMLAAAWAAAAGLAVAAWFLQTWSDFAVAWTFWGLAGALSEVSATRAAQAVRRSSAAVGSGPLTEGAPPQMVYPGLPSAAR